MSECYKIRRRALQAGCHVINRRMASTPTLPIRHRVVVNLTYACDLACAGCSHACFLKPPPIPAMSVKAFGAMLEDLCRSNMPLTKLCLMGGEPALHPKFSEIVAMAATAGKIRGFVVEIISNKHAEKTRQLLRDALATHDNGIVKVFGRRKERSLSFANNGHSMFISPLDMKFPQPYPCGWYGGHFCGGIGVDSLGFTICAMGGAIDTLLKTNVRVASVAELFKRDVQLRQVKALCSHCGAGVQWAKDKKLPKIKGTPVSPTWQKAFTEYVAKRK